MKLFIGVDTNSRMIRKISDWFGMNFNPKLSPGKVLETNMHYRYLNLIFVGVLNLIYIVY